MDRDPRPPSRPAGSEGLAGVASPDPVDDGDGALPERGSEEPAPSTAAEVAPEGGPATDGDAAGDGARRKRRRRQLLPKPIWHIGKLLIVALIVEYLVVPQVAGTRKALNLLGGVHPAWLLLGVLLEFLALVAYSVMTRYILPSDSDPGLWTIFRIQVTTLSVSHCVPAGSAAGTSLGYRLLTNAGSRGGDAGLAMSLQAAGSAVILNVIFWIALIVSIPLSGFSPLDLTAGLIGLLLVGIFTTMVVFLRRGESWAHSAIERVGRRIPFVDVAAAQRSFTHLVERFGELETDRSALVKATVWGTLNWLLDAASLFVFVGAFGHWPNPEGLILAFSISRVLAVLPITPGGLGVVEATLTSTLVGFGTPRGIAILGVIGYRLVEFWLPIPVGGLTYLSLQFEPGQTPLSRREGTGAPPNRLRRWRLRRHGRGDGEGTSAGQHAAGDVADLGRPSPGAIPERR
jgi:uncharacterized protein (TIRG00374 family)